MAQDLLQVQEFLETHVWAKLIVLQEEAEIRSRCVTLTCSYNPVVPRLGVFWIILGLFGNGFGSSLLLLELFELSPRQRAHFKSCLQSPSLPLTFLPDFGRPSSTVSLVVTRSSTRLNSLPYRNPIIFDVA